MQDMGKVQEAVSITLRKAAYVSIEVRSAISDNEKW